MNTRIYKWNTGVRLEKGGHRVFRDERDDFKAPELRRWAIADNSGTFPETTDDGVLWLDFSRPLRVEIGDFGVVSIPLKGEHGLPAGHTGGGADALAKLRDLFPHWRVDAGPKARAFARALAGVTFVETSTFVQAVP